MRHCVRFFALALFRDFGESSVLPHSNYMNMNGELPVRSVLDALHGLVMLTEEEVALIDQPLFQRLRGIRQNGLLHLVFPSATHSRLEHSIGVLYLANAMIDALLMNSRVASSKVGPRALPFLNAVGGQAIDLSKEADDDLRKFRRVVRLAALAHDLGHGPLSHAFDSFAPTGESLSLWLEDPRLAPLNELRDDIWAKFAEEHKLASTTPEALAERSVPHEIMSCVFLCVVWDAALQEGASVGADTEVLADVASAILGVSLTAEERSDWGKKWLPLAHDLIASAPADADRMDYLERDSRSIGVSYGLYDRNRLLKSMLAYRDRQHGIALRLGIITWASI